MTVRTKLFSTDDSREGNSLKNFKRGTTSGISLEINTVIPISYLNRPPQMNVQTMEIVSDFRNLGSTILLIAVDVKRRIDADRTAFPNTP